MPIFIGTAACIVIGLLAFIATRPPKFRVERSAELLAPAAVLFPLLDDFRNWVHWSPWEKLDPNLRRTYSGPESGAGATYAWAGNGQAGEGRMTILESRPDELLRIKLEFIKPFSATNETVFRLTPSGGATRVEWTMEGANGFMGKAMSLFMNMDKLVGKDFEQGLAGLEAAAKSQVLPS